MHGLFLYSGTICIIAVTPALVVLHILFQYDLHYPERVLVLMLFAI